MKSLKLLGVAAVAVFAFASIAASSAFASGPTLLFEGTKTTVLITSHTPEPSNTTPTSLESSVLDLSGVGVLLESTYLQTPSGTTGNYSTLFLKVENPVSQQKCNTAGDKTGELLLPLYKSKLVYFSLSPLTIGVIFDVEKLKFECEGATVEINGSVLGTLGPINKKVKGTEIIAGSLRCSSTSGKPEKTEYWNTAGTAENTALTVTTAKKSAEGCELIGSTSTATEEFEIEKGSSSKEVEIMG